MYALSPLYSSSCYFESLSQGLRNRPTLLMENFLAGILAQLHILLIQYTIIKTSTPLFCTACLLSLPYIKFIELNQE